MDWKRPGPRVTFRVGSRKLWRGPQYLASQMSGIGTFGGGPAVLASNA